jgi:hypothetical protein
LRVSQVDHHVYFRYTPCFTDFTFEFIRRPIPPILSPSSRTFVELTLVTHRCSLAIAGRLCPCHHCQNDHLPPLYLFTEGMERWCSMAFVCNLSDPLGLGFQCSSSPMSSGLSSWLGQASWRSAMTLGHWIERL